VYGSNKTLQRIAVGTNINTEKNKILKPHFFSMESYLRERGFHCKKNNKQMLRNALAIVMPIKYILN